MIMTPLHHHRIGRGIGATFSAALALLAVATLAPSAQAAAACTQTISGHHSGVLNVAANQKLCLSSAVQNGAVNVAPGGALSVVRSTVTGGLTLKSGYLTFDFCGSTTVRGAISATGGKGAVLIGGAPSCSANTIDGAVTLDANEAGVTLAGNRVGGAVTASANLVKTTISGNRIGGALTCTTNVPAPTNAGVRNAVGGGRSGQTCASLAF
jgi:hypothetical protein